MKAATRGLKRRDPKKNKIKHRVSFKERPSEAENRSEVGHFEADLVFNQGSMSMNTLTAIDRKSRFVVMVKNESKKSIEVIGGLKKKIKKHKVKAVTIDNGSEFAMHYLLAKQHGIKTYFCDPGSPWQKGAIERLNGMLRWRIPFQTDPKTVNQQLLDSTAHALNHTPRGV